MKQPPRDVPEGLLWSSDLRPSRPASGRRPPGPELRSMRERS